MSSSPFGDEGLFFGGSGNIPRSIGTIRDVINATGSIARAAGLTEGKSRSSRPRSSSVEPQQKRARSPEAKNRNRRIEERQESILEAIQGGGSRIDASLQRLQDLINMVSGSDEDKKEIATEIKTIIDSDGDGNISSSEMRAASRDANILAEISKISPMIARGLRDPNFRIRTIKDKYIPGGYRTVAPSAAPSQEDKVIQGYANFDAYENKYNVSLY